MTPNYESEQIIVGPAIHSKPSLLTQQNVSVEIEGELVVIKVGNSDLKMHYSDALQVSQWIRVRAKEAKHLAGDKSRHWSVVGTLHNASAEK